MTADLVLAIDQGTSSTRAIAFDRAFRPVASASVPVLTTYPQPDQVEQDPDQLVDSVVDVVDRVLREVGGIERIAAAGLDNQGETVVAWDTESGKKLAPAISWQCRRSAQVVDRLRGQGRESAIRERTGLPLDPYYSAGKMTWMLERVPGVREAARRETLRFGTVDAWLTASLDGGDARTDPSTASRTQLLDLGTGDWDADLLDWFGVPRATLPRIVSTAGDLGSIHHPRWHGSLPLRAMVCDQQAALVGQDGLRAGGIKATYGTGVFVVANAGVDAVHPASIETSIGWRLGDGPTSRIFQGGVYSAGAFIGWLEHGLGLINGPDELDAVIRSVADAGGVRVVPSLTGLGAPWWRPEVHGTMSGLTMSTKRAHIVRAGLDGICQLVSDLVEAIADGMITRPTRLRVDGGLVSIPWLVQRQADLLGMDIDVPVMEEATALGVAVLAAIGAGILDPTEGIGHNPVARMFRPALRAPERARERSAWRSYVGSVVG